MKFVGKLRRVGAWYVVDVPAALSRAIGRRGNVPIVGDVDGVALRQSMMPVSAGKHSIVMRKALRDRLQVGAGDRVTVTFEADEEPPEEAIPLDLAFALREEGVMEAFAGMTRSQRNHLLREIEAAATEATRGKRIVKAVQVALARREKALDSGAGGRQARGR